MSTTTENTTTQAPDYNIPSFIDHLEKYTLVDIEILQKTALHGESNLLGGVGRCSTALCGLCFATIEEIGFLFRTGLTPDNPAAFAKELTGGNIRNAISYFKEFAQFGPPISDSLVFVIYKMYRNKITHTLFPAFELGISQQQTNETSNNLLVELKPSEYSLNVNYLSKHVVQSIKDLITRKATMAFTPRTPIENLSGVKAAEEHAAKELYKSSEISKYPDLQILLRQILPKITF